MALVLLAGAAAACVAAAEASCACFGCTPESTGACCSACSAADGVLHTSSQLVDGTGGCIPCGLPSVLGVYHLLPHLC